MEQLYIKNISLKKVRHLKDITIPLSLKLEFMNREDIDG